MSQSYAGEGFIRCPFCDNVVREEDIVRCPRCEREGCAWVPGSVEYPGRRTRLHACRKALPLPGMRGEEA